MIFSFVRQGGSPLAETSAFPAALVDQVKSSTHLLAQGQMHTPSDTVISVCVANERLSIPYRVYYDKEQVLKCIAGASDSALIALCLGTRHYDGFLREQCLRRLLDVDEGWTAPFVVQLLGEYVIEVVQPIHERFLTGVEEKYLAFYRENVDYCEYLACRAISYWNEYYRWRIPKHKDYAAVKALAALKVAARSSRVGTAM